MDNEPIHPLIRLIGANLRKQRLLKQLSQEDLGQQLDPAVSFQQVQKYEKGANRISSDYLWQAAHILGVNIMEFYDQAEILLDKKITVKVEMPDPDDIAVYIQYQKLPIDLKPHVRNLVRGLAQNMKPEYLAKNQLRPVS